MKPSVGIFLDKRRVRRNGKFPLKLSVTANRINRSWSIGMEYSESEYARLVKYSRKEPYKDEWIEINKKLALAEKIINEMMPFFSFDEFIDRFFHKTSLAVKSERASLGFILEHMLNHYHATGQFSMKKKMSDSVQSVLKYAKADNISMRMITTSFCIGYENYMLAKSKTHTRNGAGINLRHIRILFNFGIKREFIPKEWYPFNDYVIPAERKVKRPLTKSELTKVSKFRGFTSDAQKAAVIAFLASFYFNGANAADFLRFKYSNIQGDFLIFYREKIRNSRKHDMKPIKIFMSTEVKRFIKVNGSSPVSPNRYIFDVLRPEMSQDQEYEAIQKFNQRATKSLKIIQKRLGLDKSLAMKNARHTLANILKNSSINTGFIKDILGHESVATTEFYLEGLDDPIHKRIMRKATTLGT